MIGLDLVIIGCAVCLMLLGLLFNALYEHDKREGDR